MKNPFQDKYIRPPRSVLRPALLLYGIWLSCYGQAFAQNSNLADETYNESHPSGGLESTVLYSAIDTANMRPEFNRTGEPQPVLTGINQREHEEPFKTEMIETVLSPGQQIEYMANIEQGEVLLYSWQSDGKIYFDFHAHQDGVNPDIWIRYSDGSNITSSGSIVAPYSGEHGWYWVNLDTKPVTLKLHVSGYYRNLVRTNL